ncbi:glycoside hydrolase [Rheinheimera riviphila]|uniref:Glycoside hydrolase n=1 Tax=Rheinheimera riviphila TaxID=1834037 RepID=A0A437QST3_9GAMM|nr:SH3 domain-containing protein [Rheinheimera riviphila]RVU37567.1 glycoside hydrolase [Rheinheimera riviphila]
MKTTQLYLFRPKFNAACWLGLAWLLLAFGTACSTVPLPKTPTQTSASTSSFQSDIPKLTADHLHLDYWLQKTANAEQTLLSLAEIKRFNQHLINILPEVIDVFAEPESYLAAAVRKMIVDLSHASTNPRFNQAGELLTTEHWQQFEQRLALENLSAQVGARFALVTSRGNLRTFPTQDAVFSSATDQQLDRFQETAVFPGEALQVLHYSQDRQWAFVRHYHYHGWLATAHFALAEKSVVQQFVEAKDFVLITGARAATNVTPEMPLASVVQLEMGVKLPRVRQHQMVIHGQNASFSYVVQLPNRQPDGSLELVSALIARNQDVAERYLPLTKANILAQAFKFLGERYGWGHDLNARDCSGFIGEVFRSFGLVLPRNTGSQGLESFGAVRSLAEASLAEKQQSLQLAQAGDLIFMPGHVMLVLGQESGETFVIHDVAGLHYFKADGSFYDSRLNGVSITPLSPLQRNPQQSYIDGIYLLKSLSREFYAD